MCECGPALEQVLIRLPLTDLRVRTLESNTLQMNLERLGSHQRKGKFKNTGGVELRQEMIMNALIDSRFFSEPECGYQVSYEQLSFSGESSRAMSVLSANRFQVGRERFSAGGQPPLGKNTSVAEKSSISFHFLSLSNRMVMPIQL